MNLHYVHPDKGPELWINEVGVASTHWRQGIGRDRHDSTGNRGMMLIRHDPDTVNRPVGNEAAWDNVLAALGAAQLQPRDLVKVTTFLTHRNQAEANSSIRRRRLGDARPALTVIVAQTLASAWLLEIEAVAAVVPEGGSR